MSDYQAFFFQLYARFYLISKGDVTRNESAEDVCEIFFRDPRNHLVMLVLIAFKATKPNGKKMSTYCPRQTCRPLDEGSSSICISMRKASPKVLMGR